MNQHVDSHLSFCLSLSGSPVRPGLIELASGSPSLALLLRSHMATRCESSHNGTQSATLSLCLPLSLHLSLSVSVTLYPNKLAFVSARPLNKGNHRQEKALSEGHCAAKTSAVMDQCHRETVIPLCEARQEYESACPPVSSSVSALLCGASLMRTALPASVASGTTEPLRPQSDQNLRVQIAPDDKHREQRC